MYVDRATYSFRMSFWTVPRSDGRAMPRASPVATYRASRIAAVAWIVRRVLPRARGRPWRSACMPSREEIATPPRPPSPRAIGASLSSPIWVGRSNATLRPSFPWAKRYLNRRFVSFAVPKPAYWRIVHRRPRYIVARIPRVKGRSPGKPSFARYSRASDGFVSATTASGSPLTVRPVVTAFSWSEILDARGFVLAPRFLVPIAETERGPVIKGYREDSGNTMPIWGSGRFAKTPAQAMEAGDGPRSLCVDRSSSRTAPDRRGRHRRRARAGSPPRPVPGVRRPNHRPGSLRRRDRRGPCPFRTAPAPPILKTRGASPRQILRLLL